MVMLIWMLFMIIVANGKDDKETRIIEERGKENDVEERKNDGKGDIWIGEDDNDKGGEDNNDDQERMMMMRDDETHRIQEG